jgi:glycosyltransferase involved in cell wall biosynthesis
MNSFLGSVSIVITVYNNRRFLRAAVESVLGEQISDAQCIVVDDGSTDDGLETISDLPVDSMRLQENRGFPAALNAGIGAVRHDLVTFLDSDDLMAPNGLRWRIDWMRRHPELLIAGGRPAGIIDDKGNALPEYLHVQHPLYSKPSELTVDFFRSGGSYPVMLWNYIFRRALIERIGALDESFRIACDFEYLLRVLRLTAIPIVDQPTVFRRLHEHNLSLARSGKDYELNRLTIEECRRILRPLGIEPQHWILWEKGYRND